MSAARDDVGARVDALAHELEGDEFVAAVERLADELGPASRPVLQQVLFERAAEEEGFQQAVRRRFAEKGWMRRTLARVEGAWRGDRADAVAAAVLAGREGRAVLDRETELLRAQPGKAALVLDELSRHGSATVRAWVPPTAAELLGDGAVRLVLSMTRDRDSAVRGAAVETAIRLDRKAAMAIAPDLRRRLHSPDACERIAAAWALAELGDRCALPAIDERADHADDAAERRAARGASLALRGDEATVAAGLRAHDHEHVPALAAAARILGTEDTLAALRECAEAAPDDACRAACRTELEKLRDD